MIPSPNYEAFLAVVQTGSVTEAALGLGLPRPTVSRRLARLESELGVALLHRTTRSVTPTAAGQRLFERVSPLFEQWRSIEAEARDEGAAVVGRLRVAVLPLVME